jgi:hypothetical protein
MDVKMDVTVFQSNPLLKITIGLFLYKYSFWILIFSKKKNF